MSSYHGLHEAGAGSRRAEMIWKPKIQTRDPKEASWDIVLTARANNCEAVTPKDLVTLASTGSPLRSSSAGPGTRSDEATERAP